ncbi:hypothetical protein CANCADRAFT_147466 [Tortispora caseinolytica NRRL Y-17796]|uniref:4-nitrophenylphosphatase n=1 Tax=Tortispora caseinolytica NRRL Y-17796 TaxID=767744 RepID=A0A1E4TJN3_9ASCO|nr:hypothetical protein CANCADRAFT_147466 [Tortispora caseinolytica NRRL Y-17796]
MKQEFIDKYDTFLFDCDGVLWLGTQPIVGAIEVVEQLLAHKKQVLFVTNNSTKSREQYAKKFAQLGFKGVTPDNIFGSAYATAVYLKQVRNISKAFVIGESGLQSELESEGITVLGGADPALDRPIAPEDYDQIRPDPTIEAVVSGLDHKFNYLKIAHAQAHLEQDSTLFVATNIDSTFPTNGRLFPGAGTIAAALSCCSGRTPMTMGKPSPQMMDAIKAKTHFDPNRALMIGDRLNTDIEFGNEGGLSTLLVLSGVATKEQAEAAVELQKPDYIVSSIADLL